METILKMVVNSIFCSHKFLKAPFILRRDTRHETNLDFFFWSYLGSQAVFFISVNGFKGKSTPLYNFLVDTEPDFSAENGVLPCLVGQCLARQRKKLSRETLTHETGVLLKWDIFLMLLSCRA